MHSGGIIKTTRKIICIVTLAMVAVATSAANGVRPATEDEDGGDGLTITVFDAVALQWSEDAAEDFEPFERDGSIIRRAGQVAERTLALPPLPENQRDARRITARLSVQPRLVETDGGFRPGDPWTRLGAVTVVETNETGEEYEVELMRFVTGFGGASTYRANLTSLAPLLSGETTLRVYLSTWMTPGWDVTLTLEYDKGGVGFRRPVFARRAFFEEAVTAKDPTLSTTITIPEQLDRPRIRILSTGHATDGAGGDEFISRTHILRVDGREVARWRPWAEDGGQWRPANPTSGRIEIDGRELWSSDLDRSGWHPGRVVWPLKMPLPELTPGRHTIELEIVDIRPEDQTKEPGQEVGDHGYWRVSAVVVADEPWPQQGNDGDRRQPTRPPAN